VRVLVTGGAGYIGSVTGEALQGAGHAVWVLDNMSRGHRSAVPRGALLQVGDVRDRQGVADLLRRERIDCVMHFSAASQVGESMRDPGEYFDNNVIGMMQLLRAMVDAGTPRIIFSSSAATYGEPERVPIPEDHPARPTNPYGETKVMAERMLYWFREVHGVRIAALRYFNAAGATAERGEDHTPETHLIPLALAAAAGGAEPLPVFGHDYPTPDGTCVRDYIHVADLADAHIRALERLDQLPEWVFNLGNGAGYSVREVVDAVARVTGRPVPVRDGLRRPGDPARLVASSDRARALLGWAPARPAIDAIVADAWTWMQRHPHGYGD
jgi:UDP-glucose 4-epimerase